MIFLQPAALALLSTWGLVFLFSLLRARRRRREVGALFLWQNLQDSPAARTRQWRRLLDPLLLLQFACVLALALALAQPAWTPSRTATARLALILDGSASMRTAVEAGRTRYDDALDRALADLDRSSAGSVSVVQWSRQPVVLASDVNLTAVRAALRASSPTWNADGTVDDLTRALSALGGPSRFDRILVLTDRPVAATPFSIETQLVAGGENVAVTAFSVRERDDGLGVAAFAELYNDTESVQAGRLMITDEIHRTTIETFLEPGETVPYVVPFPGSHGTLFTASLDIADDFAADNVRYYSLERPVDLRIRWIGAENRFLLAALESVLPIERVDGTESPDLTIVYDTSVPALPDGNALLVHANVAGVVALGATAPSAGTARAWSPAHPLLAGIRADDIYVERLPDVQIDVPFHTLLGVEASPFLVSIDDPDRQIVLIASDLYATNFPITVDFPLFVRTFVGSLLRPPSPWVHEWVHVGDAVPLPSSTRAIVAPDGASVLVAPRQRAFFPDRPGQYTLVKDDGRYPVSVNVAPTESIPSGDTSASAAAATVSVAAAPSERTVPLWPAAGGFALALLVAEFALFRRRTRARGRAR